MLEGKPAFPKEWNVDEESGMRYKVHYNSNDAGISFVLLASIG